TLNIDRIYLYVITSIYGVKMKASGYLSQLKGKAKEVSNKILYQEIAIDSKEPPKFYSYEKKFMGLYAIFLFYSFIILFAINYPRHSLVLFFTMQNPFAFGNAIIGLYLSLSILYSIDKVRIFIFEKYTAIKQITLYTVLIIGYFFLFLVITSNGANIMSYLLGLSTVWLILLGTRFYIYSRTFATKIEDRFITKFTVTRSAVAFITPYFILAVLVILALFYRSLLVFLSLDFLAIAAPVEAVTVYLLQMRVIMPLIYFSLILTLLFILFEFIFTRRRAETKRAGLYDNFTFSLIVLFIFFFQLLQVSIYLIMREETISAIKTTVGATSATVTYIFIFEFIISMYFLYRIVRKLGRSIGWRLLIFKKDGLMVLILGCVYAQTLSRFALQNQIPYQGITEIGQIFMADKYLVSIIIIIFLGITLLVYYLKPHETSMFIRSQKEIVSVEEQESDIVLKLIRTEYIRRGEAYPIDILERELIKATRLSKQRIYSIINTLAYDNIDIKIRNKKDDFGRERKYIDFVSVTEQFDRKGVAQKKAKKYLSQRLSETMSKKETTLRLGGDLQSNESSNQFMNSLSTNYTKKQVDEAKIKEQQKQSTFSFIRKEIPQSLKNNIIYVLKKEYTYRVENADKYPDFHFCISEIASEIQTQTRITVGELYPILDIINESDIEFELLDNPEESDDKIISFFPIADDDLCYLISNFRPDEYAKIKIRVTKQFMKFFNRKKVKATFAKLRKAIIDRNEVDNSWKQILTRLENYFVDYSNIHLKVINGEGEEKIFDQFPKKDITIFDFE
ncbi:MAG: hypothetical protein MUP85_01885, partial [Candidatus Lokiarchaeota archaeon]|nr:hypothetical protein [Candidatus Lokiarchaeota archaeon]